MSLFGRYYRQDLTDEVLSLVVQGGVIRVEVMNAGPMAGLGLSDADAADRGKMKNHWRFAAVLKDDNGTSYGTTFGVDPENPASDEQNADFVRSKEPPMLNKDVVWKDIDRSGTAVVRAFPIIRSASGVPTGSKGKPPMWSDKEDFEHIVSLDKSGASIVHAPAGIRSASGVYIRQRAEGTPQAGIFGLRISEYYTPSDNTFAVFHIPVTIERLTLGEILLTFEEQGMFPFFFRKLDFAIFGCRDFIFNAVARLIEKGYTDGFVKEEEKHIFELLNFRYSRAREDIVGAMTLKSSTKARYFESAVDRAVWPQGFIAAVDDRVKFN
ncbi:hypothetical protein HETIRDRAFT_455685 [Heterobasidion irregulare TC 32-1]|uniref:Uncharacterized protein n=1 Tax=Heterobasidion irregulare (strain TC 32-1) TaxID=747525 RepID=W4JTA1_HETIT|nr:uncharacterized protein HETIRDRAFT_455685 [Heterobasidion irregulare TC 32-1]ETW76121.1 hypothetical protein HETIRDRAFT_455685 [Heterobasidion irregulare TC 32-1]